MSDVLTICYIGLFLASILSLTRLIVGPTTLDRVLAFDAVALCAAGMIILFSIQVSSIYYIELLLIFSLLGFTTVLGYLDYLSHLKNENNPDQEEDYDFE